MDTIIYLSYLNHAHNTYEEESSKTARKCKYNIRECQPDGHRMIKLEIFEPEPRKMRKVKPLYYLDRYRRERESRRIARQIRQELAPILDERYDNFIMYHKNVPKECWIRELLPFEEFDRYMDPKWIKVLLKYAVNTHFVVLGNAPCIQEILCELASNMKTLLWIAPDLTYQEQLEDFAEQFFQEYGLAINLNFVPDNGTYAQMHIPDQRYSDAVNILDFTGEKYIPFFNPPEGSVWIDMASVEEKERRIEARRIKAVYYSLKKQWRALI